MIFQDLMETTSALQEIQRKMEIKSNKEQQEGAEAKYRVLLTQTNQLVDIVYYLNNNSSYRANPEIISQMDKLLNDFETAIVKGYVSKDSISSLDGSVKSIQNGMKKEWPKQFTNIAGSKLSTLEAIKGINSDEVGACIDKINLAQSWNENININNIQLMIEGLEEADNLISNMDLDEEIVVFLEKTNNGRATLNDLSEKVLSWIKKEKLENKIRISFVKISLN